MLQQLREKYKKQLQQKKLQKQFLAHLNDEKWDDLLKDIQQGASVAFFGDPAYGLKHFINDLAKTDLDILTQSQYVEDILLALGGVSTELLIQPDNQHIEQELFLMILQGFPSYTDLFVKYAASKEALSYMETKIRQEIKYDSLAESFFQSSLDLIHIQKEKEVLQQSILIPDNQTTNQKKTHKI